MLKLAYSAADGSGFSTLSYAYSYDAIGNITQITETSAPTRSYTYDKQNRYYDPVVGRYISADSFASTGQGILGTNMFVYCLNNPVNSRDSSGNLALVDDFLVTGLILASGIVAFKISQNLSQEIYKEITNISQLVMLPQINMEATAPAEPSAEPGEPAEPSTPNVKYPGDDPAKAPEGTQWRGEGEQGSKQGNYYNSKTHESWHPDLNHNEPIGPHWDYKDPNNTWWRIFKNNTVALK